MDMNTIESLRPVDHSSAEIRSAILRIKEHRSLCAERLDSAKSERGHLLLEGTQKEIAAKELEVKSAEETIADLDAMLPILAEDLKNVLLYERIMALREQIYGTGYEQGCKEFAESFAKEYGPAAKKIASLMAREAALLAQRRQIIDLVNELKELGETEDLPDTSTPAAVAGLPIRVSSFGEMVRLPGIKGAPQLRFETVTRTEVRRVPNPVYNEATRKTTICGEKDHIDQITESVPVAKDAPIWWPKTRLP